jgi:hypothetical protein
MGKPRKVTICFLLTTIALFCGMAASVPVFAKAAAAGGAKSTSELLQQGLYAEEVEGNIDAAIKAYGQVIQKVDAPRNHIAQALYRQGMCYLKTKDEQARPVLDDLTNFDPAALMPPETLIYVELGSPGRQVETILNMLKGTPYENPLAAIGGGATAGGGGQKSPADMMAALLNPSMMAEFKKIRSSAIGVTGIAQNNPPMIAVLYPGKSDALRGLILAGLGMAGQPGDAIEDMNTITIPRVGGVAYDDRVILIAQPASQLQWCVRQYKGLISEPTLASSNQSFSKISKKQRQNNAVTIWANVDEVYSRVLQMFPAGQVPKEVLMANAFVDFNNIDYITVCDSIEQDGFSDVTEIVFKDGHNCLAYDMIRTPNISKAALQAVPSDAVALASFALSQADSVQAETVRAKVKNITGLDIGREIFANIEQVTVFAVSPKQASPFFAGYMGVVVTSHNPQQTREILARILGAANAMLSGQPATVGEVDLTAGRYQVGMVKGNPIYCYIEQVGKATILSVNPEVTQAAVAAIKDGNSICSAGPLAGAVSKLPPAASKLVLVNAGGAIRLAGPAVIASFNFNEEQRNALQSNFDQLALAADKTTIEYQTDEQLNSLVVNSKLTGLPPLNQIFGPVTQIAGIIQKAKGEATAKQLRQATPATIIPTSKPPVIDGNEDDIWSAAPRYEIANVMYSPPSSPNDLSAECRAMWDQDNLYMFIDVTDDKLENYTKDWYMDDCIEIFIDADNSKSEKFGENDYQYHFDWDRTNPQMDEDEHHKTQGVEFAMVTTEKGYRTEIKFPWSTLGTKPLAGEVIGFEVMVNDDDSGQRTKIGWRGKKDVASSNPRTWGTAQLGGLIGWWKFDEGSGDTARDSSGNGRDGIISGATWKSSGWDGKGFCLEFGGDGDYVVDDNAGAWLNGLEALTVSVWVKSDVTSTDRGIILFCEPDAVHERGMRYDKQGTHGSGTNVIKCGVTTSGGSQQMESSNNAQTTEWQHLVMTWSSGNKVQLYINGKLDTPTSNEESRAGVIVGSTKLLIGKGCKYRASDSDDAGWDGLIDDVRVYNYALSDAEIKELSKRQAGDKADAAGRL